MYRLSGSPDPWSFVLIDAALVAISVTLKPKQGNHTDTGIRFTIACDPF
jgi:hypothetical protein